MGYNKTTWKKGDIITATGLNNIESNLSLVINLMESLGTSSGSGPYRTAIVDTESVTNNSTTMDQLVTVSAILASRGVKHGLAPISGSGIIPSKYLPSYVDEILEYASKNNFPTGTTDEQPDDSHTPSGPETGKIYVAKDTGRTYRWSGSEYVEIGITHLDYKDDGTDTNNGTADSGTSFGASNSKIVTSVTLTDGQIKVIHRNISPSITWTDAVDGTNDNKPTIEISVSGRPSSSVTPNEASTQLYGITKLSSSISSSSESVAATPKAVLSAVSDAHSYTDNAINALDGGTITGLGAASTITSLTQTNGQISASALSISIASSQINDRSDSINSNSSDTVATSKAVKSALDSANTNTANAIANISITKSQISDLADWAKSATKPSYTATEVGALPASTQIPSIDGLANDTDPTFTITTDTGNVTFIDSTDETISVTFTIAELQALKALISNGE